MIKHYCSKCKAEAGPQEIALGKCLTANCGGKIVKKEVEE